MEAPQQSLYDGDALWLEDVVAKLRSHDFDYLDTKELIEEVESLGR